MFPFGLKTKIALNLIVLLAAAMLLTNFVMIISVQRILINNAADTCELLATSIEPSLIKSGETGTRIDSPVISDHHAAAINAAGYTCLLLLDPAGATLYSAGSQCTTRHDELASRTRKAIAGQKRVIGYIGNTWGVFWKYNEHLIVSVPLSRQGEIIGGAGILLKLDPIYQTLRKTQSFLFIYILINCIVFTMIGVYRISKISVKPLYRLLRRAESYRDEDELFFMDSAEENEFNQLSRALNRMIHRISEDRDHLQSTIRSLEDANEELSRAQRDVIRAEKLASVGRLSAGIAHEIGNPIAIVVGYLDLLKNDDISEVERREFLDRAEAEISRIHGIIRQLLDFSRPSSGDREEVDVRTLLTDVTGMLDHQPLMADISVETDLNATTHKIIADADQLRQVFLNLIINAADAVAATGNDAGVIRIDSAVIDQLTDEAPDLPPPILRIRVTDNGVGIPGEHLDDVFDPFYTTKDPGKGTGLGLSTAIMIVEQLGGRIQANSREGEGTTMTLYLPIVQNEGREGNGERVTAPAAGE